MTGTTPHSTECTWGMGFRVGVRHSEGTPFSKGVYWFVDVCCINEDKQKGNPHDFLGCFSNIGRSPGLEEQTWIWLLQLLDGENGRQDLWKVFKILCINSHKGFYMALL